MKVCFYLNYSRGRLFAVAVDKIFQLREVQGLIVYASDEIAPTWIEESNFNFVPLFLVPVRSLSDNDLALKKNF